MTLLFIPMIFSIYQNRSVRKRLNTRLTTFEDAFKRKEHKEVPQEQNKSLTQCLIEKYPDLTPNELMLCDLLYQKMSSKDIANQLNITHASVNTARYRLRKKLKLSNKEDLVVFLTHLYK